MALVTSIDTVTAPARLRSWLAKELPQVAEVEVSEIDRPLAGGLSNDVLFFHASWRVNGIAEHHDLVARMPPPTDGIYRTNDPASEARVMRTLAEHTAIPVPKVLFECDDPEVLGAPFLVMERRRGRVPPDDPPFTMAGWVLDLTSDQRSRLADNALRQLCDIHAADWRGLGLEFLEYRALAGHDVRSPQDGRTGLDLQITYWSELYEWAAEESPSPTVEAALQWAHSCRPDELGPPVLNWGDARTGNMIFAEDLTVTGVIDWEMATVAQPELDLGWWLFGLRFHTEGIGVALPPGYPSRLEAIERYEALTGHPVRHIEYYEGFAALRLSIASIRAGRMMIEAGLLPPDSPMPTNNPASQLLARMLDLPAPAGTTVSYIGNR